MPDAEQQSDFPPAAARPSPFSLRHATTDGPGVRATGPVACPAIVVGVNVSPPTLASCIPPHHPSLYPLPAGGWGLVTRSGVRIAITVPSCGRANTASVGRAIGALPWVLVCPEGEATAYRDRFPGAHVAALPAGAIGVDVARNACVALAVQYCQADWCLMMDDDVTAVRWEGASALIGGGPTDASAVTDDGAELALWLSDVTALLPLIPGRQLVAVGGRTAGWHHRGPNGVFTPYGVISQFIMWRLSFLMARRLLFKGHAREDFDLLLRAAAMGGAFGRAEELCIHAPPMGSGAGGMATVYATRRCELAREINAMCARWHGVVTKRVKIGPGGARLDVIIPWGSALLPAIAAWAKRQARGFAPFARGASLEVPALRSMWRVSLPGWDPALAAPPAAPGWCWGAGDLRAEACARALAATVTLSSPPGPSAHHEGDLAIVRAWHALPPHLRSPPAVPRACPPRRPLALRWSVCTLAAWRLVVAWLAHHDVPVTHRREAGTGQTATFSWAGRSSLGCPAHVRLAMELLRANLSPGGRAAFAQLNKNYLPLSHRDLPLNGGGSVLLSGGDYTGGRTRIGGITVDGRTPVAFDGRVRHEVEAFTGLRVSAVFFTAGDDFAHGGLYPPIELLPEGAAALAAGAAYHTTSPPHARGWAPPPPLCSIPDAGVLSASALKHAKEVAWQAKHAPGGGVDIASLPLKLVPPTVLAPDYIEAAFRGGYTDVDVLLDAHWESFARHSPAIPSLTQMFVEWGAQRPYPPRLSTLQLEPILVQAPRPADAPPHALTAPPLFAPLPNDEHLSEVGPYEFVRIWAIRDPSGVRARLLIHPYYTNLSHPAPPRIALPSPWDVARTLFTPHRQIRLYHVDAASWFYQLLIPPTLRRLLRLRVLGEGYDRGLTRLPMGATWSVPPAHALFCSFAGIPPGGLTDEAASTLVYIDGALFTSDASLRRFEERAEAAGVKIGECHPWCEECEFIGAVFNGTELSWRLRPRRVDRLSAASVAIATTGLDTVPPVEVYVAVARALSALYTLAIPYFVFPALIEFLSAVGEAGGDPVAAVARGALTPALRADLGAVCALARSARRCIAQVPTPRPEVRIAVDACTHGSWDSGWGGWGCIVQVVHAGSVWWGSAQGAFPPPSIPLPDPSARYNNSLLEFYGVFSAVVLATQFGGSVVTIATDNTPALNWARGSCVGSHTISTRMRWLRRWCSDAGIVVHFVFLAGVSMTATADTVSRGYVPPHRVALWEPGYIPEPSDPRGCAPLGAVHYTPQCREAAYAVEDTARGAIPPLASRGWVCGIEGTSWHDPALPQWTRPVLRSRGDGPVPSWGPPGRPAPAPLGDTSREPCFPGPAFRAATTAYQASRPVTAFPRSRADVLTELSHPHLPVFD